MRRPPAPVDLRGRLRTRLGARPYYERPIEGIQGVTIHYTASSPYASPDAIAAYQTGPSSHLEFPAVAYTLLVDAWGTTYQCHDLDVRCWHSGAVVDGVARNASHIGICWIGSDGPTALQVEGIADAFAWCETQLGKRLTLEGHRDSYSTACPGANWATWRRDVERHIERWRTENA